MKRCHGNLFPARTDGDIESNESREKFIYTCASRRTSFAESLGYGSNDAQPRRRGQCAAETEGTHRQGLIGSDMEKMIIAATPLGRLGQPEDIARAAVFLASDEANWITGERIAVSGGLG